MGAREQLSSDAVATAPAAPPTRSRTAERARGWGLRLGLSVVGPIGFVLLWQLASGTIIDPFLLPPPTKVWAGAVELWQRGALQESMAISMFRILAGWLIGSITAIPIGLMVGASQLAKQMIDPFVHFLRFIPAIALVTIFILWFGVGEESKIALIVYSSAFIVLVNTATGVAAIPSDKVHAARCLGASPRQAFVSVITPAAIPYAFAGMRIAMATAFVVIVAAEIIAANSGLGYLVWTSRLYFRVDWVFAGVVTIGILGFITDRLWNWAGSRIFGRYLRQGGQY